jgi:hypothetical protein
MRTISRSNKTVVVSVSWEKSGRGQTSDVAITAEHATIAEKTFLDGLSELRCDCAFIVDLRRGPQRR